MDKKGSILVVDDNSECRKLLVWVLERHGFHTISASCGFEAVKFAIESQPRLVLMDLSMPGMNGYEATQAIHAHRRGRKIPVIAVSADCSNYGDASRVFKASFIACVSKPWEENALLQIVRDVLGRGVQSQMSFSSPEKAWETSVRSKCS